MKKVMFALGIVFVLSCLGLGYISFLYSDIKKDNLKLEKEFENLNQNIEYTDEINKNNELKLKELKEVNKEVIKELELWKQMKEKITSAL